VSAVRTLLVLATSYGLVGLVGLSVMRVDLRLIVLSGGLSRVNISGLVLGGLLIVLVVVLLVVVSLALAEGDVCTARARSDGNVGQSTVAFNAASLADLSVFEQLGQIFAVEFNVTANSADGELQVGLLGELDFRTTRSGVDANNSGAISVQLVPHALNLEVAEVNRGLQEVSVEVSLLFENNAIDGDRSSVSNGSQLTNTNVLNVDETSDGGSGQERSTNVLQSNATDLAEDVDASTSVDVSNFNVTSLGGDINVVEDFRARCVLESVMVLVMVFFVMLVRQDIDNTSFGKHEQIGGSSQ